MYRKCFFNFLFQEGVILPNFPIVFIYILSSYQTPPQKWVRCRRVKKTSQKLYRRAPGYTYREKTQELSKHGEAEEQESTGVCSCHGRRSSLWCRFLKLNLGWFSWLVYHPFFLLVQPPSRSDKQAIASVSFPISVCFRTSHSKKIAWDQCSLGD